MTPQEKWDALSEKGQQQLLERFRGIDTQDEWYEPIYEKFIQRMSIRGVDTNRIYFSGFCSQGDGACFEGSVFNWARFLIAINADPEYVEIPNLREVIAFAKQYEDEISFAWQHKSSHYYHENTVEFERHTLIIGNPFDEETNLLRHVAWRAVYGEGGPLEPLTDVFIQWLRDEMRTLYDWLEELHDDLTSDEHIQAYILDFCEEDIDDQLSLEQEEREVLSLL